MDPLAGSEYIRWAKTAPLARFNLTTSGLANLKLEDLTSNLNDLEVTGNFPDGYPPLIERIAARFGVDASGVVTASGTSFANHLAMSAVLRPGDEVLIEHPAYEPLLSVARYFGATVKRFERRFENAFAIVPEEIERLVSHRTRLIVLTNLHNPTGAMTGEPALRKIGDIARRNGAHVLVDEVYLESLYDRRPATAAHYGPEFIVTSSLTKAFGLGGLRCGWILAEPALADRMRRLNDLFGVAPVHVGEQLSFLAMEAIERISSNARMKLQRGRQLAYGFLDSRDDLQCFKPEFGTLLFPRLKSGNAREFCRIARDKYDTAVVPGDFFESPAHFRIGLGGDIDFEEALRRIGLALDDAAHSCDPRTIRSFGENK